MAIASDIAVALGLIVAAGLGLTVNVILTRFLIRISPEQLAERHGQSRNLAPHVGVVVLLLGVIALGVGLIFFAWLL